jgi:hypothetical protein
MPARDGTGPVGQGAHTGRGMGNCQPGVQPAQPTGKGVWWNPLSWLGGVIRPGTGLGRGIRRGSGRGGRGRW